MKRLQRMGYRFALDDFGVGVNSLCYLKALPVDAVKLDGMFVRDLTRSARSRATVSAVTQLCGAYGIACVAEYVESQAILNLLRELGVGYAQGYAIHRPEPLPAVLETLQLEDRPVTAAQ
jgi:EAL domain-containing protein (putative c-di-GMP-specific phosphodiesterase class I)